MMRWSCILVLVSAFSGCRKGPPLAAPEGISRDMNGSAASEDRALHDALRPVTLLAGDFQWRQRVTARWPGGTRSFEAVLAKETDTLRLIGLGPMGRVGFVLLQRDGQPMEFENHANLSVPFDPKNILLDVQRVYYPWFVNSPGEDGVRQRSIGEEVVFERWKGGKLLERRFRPSRAADDAQDISVSYHYDSPPDHVASRAVLNNSRQNYELEIQTFSRQDL